MDLDSSGGLYLPSGTAIRYISPQGIISTVASAHVFTSTIAVKLEPNSDTKLVVSDTSCIKKRMDVSTGVVNTLVGTAGCGFAGDGGPLSAAMLYGTASRIVAFDLSGNLYIGDRLRLRKVLNG